VTPVTPVNPYQQWWKETLEPMSASGEWTVHAACRTTDPDTLFVQGAAQNRAKVICSGCQVRTECLADALDNRVEFGVWGGMTERERRALLRRRPQVTSWRELLLSARDEYERAQTPSASRAS
jgi:WhiB family redox-sensing transcriptional regulator